MPDSIKRVYVSGEKVAYNGFYLYSGHVDPSIDDANCGLLRSEMKMFFAQDSRIPKPLSCSHPVKYELICRPLYNEPHL